MGRAVKFHMGHVVWWRENNYKLYGVIVGHEVGKWGDSFYDVVVSDAFGKHRGRKRRFRSHLLHPVRTPSGNIRIRKGVALAYRKNRAIEQRPCDCHCCVH